MNTFRLQTTIDVVAEYSVGEEGVELNHVEVKGQSYTILKWMHLPLEQRDRLEKEGRDAHGAIEKGGE